MTTKLSHQESIKYLRDSAIRAHLDGQGAKARQLAAIALRREASRGNLPVVNLEDLVWAFFLIIYWMLEEWDFSIVLDDAWKSLKKKEEQEKDTTTQPENHDAWFSIIRFLMDSLRPAPLTWDANIKALEDIPRSFFSEKRKDRYTNITLRMILPLVVDFVHYLYPDKKGLRSNALIWHSLCRQWESYAMDEQNEDLRETMMTTRNRKEKQHACLLSPATFPYKAENALEEFWDAFYEINIAEMRNIIPRLTELTRLAQEDVNRFYPVQRLINMTRFIIGTDAPDQLPGLYRLQRAFMENPQWLFSHLRSTKFSDELNKAYFEVQQGNTASSNSVQLWRLPLISEIIALQNWDLANYLNSRNMQSKSWLFRGLLSSDYKEEIPSDSDAEDLKTGIYQAIKGVALQNKKNRHFNDVSKAFMNLELNGNSEIKINELLGLITEKIRPVEMRSAVNLFSIMSDAIPKKYVKDVFKISIESFSETNNGIDLSMLNWWVNIFKWIDLDKTDWELVDPILTDLFQNPFFWHNSNEMLKEALIKAPKDLADKWANMIAESRNKEDLYPNGCAVVYNASLERSDLTDYALRILDFLEEDPSLAAQMAYDRALLIAADEDKTAVSEKPEGKKLRMALFKQLLQYAQSVADRTDEPRIHIVSVEASRLQRFQRISWVNLEKEEWKCIDQVIKSAINNRYCSECDFIFLLSIWSVITSQQEKNVIDEAGGWLIDLCRNFQFKSEQLSHMSCIAGVKDSIRFVKTSALSRFLHRVSSSICKDMLSWIQDEIPETDEANLPTIWGMFFALYITGTRAQSIWTLNALKAIYARIVTDTLLLTKVAERTYDVLITPHREKGKRLIETFKGSKAKAADPILNALDKVIGKLVQAPLPDGRRAAALVLKVFGEMNWINEQRGNWIENLKKDPRARVFSVLKER